MAHLNLHSRGQASLFSSRILKILERKKNYSLLEIFLLIALVSPSFYATRGDMMQLLLSVKSFFCNRKKWSHGSMVLAFYRYTFIE
jgi:hypothetical protein